MITQQTQIDPADIDYETIQRYVAMGRRSRSIAFSNFVRGIFRRESGEDRASDNLAAGTPAHC